MPSRIHREALPEPGILQTGAVRFLVCELCTPKWMYLAFPQAIQLTRLDSHGGVGGPHRCGRSTCNQRRKVAPSES